jgi:hypothetical protein
LTNGLDHGNLRGGIGLDRDSFQKEKKKIVTNPSAGSIDSHTPPKTKRTRMIPGSFGFIMKAVIISLLQQTLQR